MYRMVGRRLGRLFLATNCTTMFIGHAIKGDMEMLASDSD